MTWAGILEFVATCAGVGVLTYVTHRLVLRQTHLADRKRGG